MTNIQAAVGVAQMERVDSFVSKKKYVREYYSSKLNELTGKGYSFFPTTEGASCWFSGIVLPEGNNYNDAKDVCNKLKEKEVEARPFWKPVHLQIPYSDCPKSSLLVSENLWQRIITLPCSTTITESDLLSVVTAVTTIV